MADAPQHRKTAEGIARAMHKIRGIVRARWRPGTREQSITSQDLAQTVARRLLKNYAEVFEPDANPEDLERLAKTILKNYLEDRRRHGQRLEGKGGRERVSLALDEAELDRPLPSDPRPVEAVVLARKALEELRRFARGDGPVASAIPDANRRKRLVRILFLHEVKEVSSSEIGELLGLSKNRVNEELSFARALFASAFSAEEEKP